MAGKTFKLSIVVDATTKSAQKGLGNLKNILGGVALGGAALGTAVVGGAALAGGALVKLAIDAAPLAGIKSAFEGIATASGQSADVMLAALQKGSAGMIAQRDLMMKYNLAAQLVGDQFANELPNAMGYLGKVAAATGEDMGFMMDSLVRGVGRLSPMILDNLGIQVNLTEANEAYAATLGKTAAELTKTEQQTALMNQVMEKLAVNTANMPDVAGTAATSIAKLRTKFKDFKDTVGLALVPVLNQLLGMFTSAAEWILPKVSKMIENLAPMFEDLLAGAINFVHDAVENLGAVFAPLINYFRAVVGEGDYLNDWLTHLPEPIQGVVEALGRLISFWREQWPIAKQTLLDVWQAIWPVFVQMKEWLAEKIIGIIETLRNLWMQYWPKAKEIILNFWDAVQPVLVKVGEWLAEHIPIAIEALRNLWTAFWSVAKEIIARFWDAIQPVLIEIRTWLSENIPVAIEKLKTLWMEYWPKAQQALADFWTATQSTLTQVREWLAESIPVAIEKLKALWMEYWPRAKETLVNFWNAIKPALIWIRDIFIEYYTAYLPQLQIAWEILREGWKDIVDTYNKSLKPALEELWGVLEHVWETLGLGEGSLDGVGSALGRFTGFLVALLAAGVIEAIKGAIYFLTLNINLLLAAFELGVHWGIRIRDVLDSMIGVFNNIRHWISVVIERFEHLKHSLSNFQLPWWLQMGSPTPLEMGLLGIGEALAEVQGLAIKGLNFGGGMALAGAGASIGGGGFTTVNIINRFGPGSVRSEQDILDIADEITRTLELRGIGPAL